jgi:H+/Cl- antiporter ClcA
MLPLGESWYRRLLLFAVALGLAGGLISLAYSGVTGLPIRGLFGEPSADPWSGRWWWIPLVAAGGLAVAALRRLWSVSDDVPGAVALAEAGWVDPAVGPRWVVVSVVSLCFGASLGPSFGIVVAGGSLGAWLARRAGTDDEDVGRQYATTGMAGSLGALFSAPLFSTILAGELSPSPRQGHAVAFTTRFLSATLGYVVYFGVTGAVMLDAFSIPGYAYENVHLLYGVVLGLASVVALLVFSVVGKAVARVADAIADPYLRGVVGGAMIGLLAFALPLTVTGGSGQLAWATENWTDLGIGLLAITVVGKMVAVALSQRAGFLGGTVFPMIFVGGTAGLFVAASFDAIPVSLAVAAMIAAIPAAIISAPISFILIAVGGVGLGVAAIPPIGISVLTAQLVVGALKLAREAHQSM